MVEFAAPGGFKEESLVKSTVSSLALALVCCLVLAPAAVAQRGIVKSAPKETAPAAETTPAVNAQLPGRFSGSDGDTAGLPSAADEPGGPSAPQSFSNTTPITITDCPGTCTTPQAASVYSSDIAVSGVVGVVERVSVTLNGFSHAFPGDVDILLVSPTGRKSVIMSDFAASATQSVSNINLTLDDYAATPIPPGVATGNTGFQLASGSYRPSNSGTTDVFPAPAPAGPYTYTLSAFNGQVANGTWSLYVVDDANLDGGSISGGWTISFDSRPPAPATGSILISEFRTRGTGTAPPTSDGSADEFIELYNNTDSNITIIDAVPGADPTLAAGAGWRFGVAQGAAETTFFVLPQTLSTAGPLAIPARGHYLIATQPSAASPTGNTYSLTAYPTGTGITASGSPNIGINPAVASGFIPDDAGIAVFSTTNALTTNRLDSVGVSSVLNPNYKEGTGLSPSTGITTASQHSWVRKYSTATGRPQDTGDNASDFVLVETTGAMLNGVQSVLGAPGPERGPTVTAYTTTSAPIPKTNAEMTARLVDLMQSQSAAPNRVRDLTPVTNGSQGTLAVRRCLTNNTGNLVTSMRYRVIDITTLGNGGAGLADLRVLNSPLQTITITDASSVTLQAMTVQTPAAQASGGGVNSTLSEGVITTTAPLAAGATTCVQFTLGVQQTGNFRFYVVVEANPKVP
jgi:subtilisin-like proprotein convertase family protein